MSVPLILEHKVKSNQNINTTGDLGEKQVLELIKIMQNEENNLLEISKRKIKAYKAQTRTKKQLFLAFISATGRKLLNHQASDNSDQTV